jgi:hypothetical protein
MQMAHDEREAWPAIMAALGRIEDDADLLETARIVATRKLPTKDALESIRRWRQVQKS